MLAPVGHEPGPQHVPRVEEPAALDDQPAAGALTGAQPLPVQVGDGAAEDVGVPVQDLADRVTVGGAVPAQVLDESPVDGPFAVAVLAGCPAAQ